MENVPIQIRHLESVDAISYREIRLEGRRCNPEAYGSTFAAESAKPPSWFSDRVRASNLFGAFQSSEPVGVAGLVIREGQKEGHKGLLVDMYVRPQARNTGVGRRLVEQIIEFARTRVERIRLAVVREKEQAR